MTDPLSITASTLTLLGMLKAAKQGIDTLREIRHAPDIVVALVNELSEFQLTLEHLRQLSELHLQNDVSHESLQKLLKRCMTAIQETLDLLSEKVSLFRKIGKLSEENAERLGWLFSKGTIRVHQERLQHLRHELLTALSSTTLSQCVRARMDIEEIETANSKLYERVHNVDTNVNASKEVIVQGLMNMDQRIGQIQAQLGHGIQGSGKANVVRVIASANTGFQDCDPYCDCPCHRALTILQNKSPHLLDRCIGSLFLKYSATPSFTPQCVMSCRHRASKKRIHVSYFFPIWCYWRAISVAISISDSGPELLLRMPRAVPAGWKLFGRAYNNDVPALRQLIITKQAAPTDTDVVTGRTALHQAAWSGAIESCQLLLHTGADPHAEDKSRQTPYLLAWSHILSNDLGDEKSQKLRELFTDTSYLEEWALSTLHRIVLGFIVVALDVETLAWSESNVNAIDNQGRTALFWASSRKDIENVDFLLQHGADPNIRALDGQTAIHAAAKSGSEHIVHRLVNYGADINDRDENLKLPLHLAVARRWDIEYLIRLNSDVSALDCYSRSALWYAAEKDSPDNVQALLRSNADPNTQDKSGWSPLHIVMERNQHNMAKLLIANGADVALLTGDGRSVLHFAAEFGDVETLDMLSQVSLKGLDPGKECARGSGKKVTRLAITRPNQHLSHNIFQQSLAGGITAHQMAVQRHVAAETAGAELGEKWNQAFERLIEEVISHNSKAHGVEDLEENEEELFSDAQESIGLV